MELTAVGIDVSKLKFDVAVWVERKKYKTKVFSNNQSGFLELKNWLFEYQKCQVCLKATGAYSLPLSTFLFEHGIAVSVENPAKINAFGKAELSRNKTDKSDAKMIALYCALHVPLLSSAGRTLHKRLYGILNAGNAESLNSKIRLLKIKSRGYRNKERFKRAVMFHYGKLNMAF
ncbi:transposase (plasmid) [Hafnia alvei]|uniref:IS110 family transposase n=1 Tax=Hafnia alvei TaxID=569 RepID=UPI0016429060|nr:transposase [Hafnia alvei]MBI0278612.1 transposase [Hafnia alvei]